MSIITLVLGCILVGSLLAIALLVYSKSGLGAPSSGPGASLVAWSCSLWMVSLALFNSYFASVRVLGAIDLTVDRVVCGIMLAGMAGMIYHRRSARGLDKSLDLIILVFLTLCLVSMSIHGFLAAHPSLGKPWFVFLAGYLLPAVAYVCAKYFLVTESDDICVMRGLYVLGLALVVIALMEGVGLRDYVFPHYIADKTIPLHLDRARGPFLNAAFTGMALCVCLVAGLSLLPLSRFPTRIMQLAALALFVPAIYFTRTRSVYLALCIIAAGAIVGMRTTFPKWKVYTLPLCLVGALLAANLGRFASEERTSGGLGQMREVAIRFELANKSLEIIRERPFFGLGLAQFRSTAVASLDEAEYQHNHLLGLAAELGLTGLAVYMCFLGLLFWRLFRLLPYISEQRFYNTNFFFLLGLALLVNLISNTFVEPSLHIFSDANFFLFAGIIDRFYNRYVLERG